MPVYPEDPFGSIKEAKKDTSPEPKTVNTFHSRSDLDSATTAQHHTLGPKANQATPGDHIHDGRSSKKLLDGILLGTIGSPSWEIAVDQALRRLGAN